ncbi:MAG: acetate/propionate family kinase [Rhodocyclaceae bacterium]
MSPAQLTDFLLEKVALFEGFERGEVEQIVAASDYRSFEGSESIIACGEEGRFMGVLVSGHAEVSVVGDAGQRVLLGKLEAGHIFGEMSLLTGDRTVADVIAGNRCFVLLIPQSVFSDCISVRPKATKHLVRLLKDRAKASAVDVTSSHLHANALAQAEDPYALSLKNGPPGKILVLNAGRSQIRFGIYDTGDKRRTVHGVIDNLAGPKVRVGLDAGGAASSSEVSPFPIADVFTVIFQALKGLDDVFQFSPDEVIAVGHRVVHGGSKFSNSTVVTPQVLADIEELAIFAPFHNPVNVEGIRAAMAHFPAVPHVAVFDTAFHQSLPPYAYLYGLPYNYYKQEGIRRYGFHGTSHRYVSMKTAEALKRPLGELEIVSCHLGIGSSLCAIDHGRSVDTSMGMTPSEGLIMATRAGNLDPAVMIHLMEHYHLDATALSQLINAESGVLGISGISSDFHDIEAAASEGHHRALLAHKAYCYQVRKTIGAYVAAMGGIDVLAFTGRIGETSAAVRSLACQGLSYMGIKLDEARNRNLGAVRSHAEISADDSPVKILVVASDDERVVAWEALRAIEHDQINQTIRRKNDAPIPIEVSAHHVHLAQADVEALFGPGHQLRPEHELSQPGQFACKEKVNLIGPKGRITNVRVLGPARKETQVEIAMTEQFKLGIQPPIRESGDLVNTPGVLLQGTYGSTTIERGVICAQRHIHMSPEDALGFGLRDKYVVRVRVEGDRELIYGDVVVRVNPNYRLAMHIDTDEGNAANIRTGMIGHVVEIQNRR